MLVKAIEFGGCCATCPPNNEAPARGGVEIGLENGRADECDMGEMICLRCAQRLVERVTKAIAECKKRRTAGEEYRNDEWQKPAKKRSSVSPSPQERQPR